MRPKNYSGITDAIPRLTRGFLVLLFFVSYLILYLFTVNLALGKISVLRDLSQRFIPAYRNFIPGFSYVGFVVPLTTALIVSLLILLNSRPPSCSLALEVFRNRSWLIASALSVAVWYIIPGLASGGHTDFPLAILVCVYVGWHLDEGRPKQSVLASIVLGFGIGFVSDLQSQTFFTGIFGGWGLLDGDLIGTIVLPLATLTGLIILRMLPRKDNSTSLQSAEDKILYHKQRGVPRIYSTCGRAIQTDRSVRNQSLFEDIPVQL